MGDLDKMLRIAMKNQAGLQDNDSTYREGNTWLPLE